MCRTQPTFHKGIVSKRGKTRPGSLWTGWLDSASQYSHLATGTTCGKVELFILALFRCMDVSAYNDPLSIFKRHGVSKGILACDERCRPVFERMAHSNPGRVLYNPGGFFSREQVLCTGKQGRGCLLPGANHGHHAH